MKHFALPLMMAAMALPAASARAEMSAVQKKEVEALVRQYILDNGDVLIESVNKYQAKAQAEADKQYEGKAKELARMLKDDKNVAQAGNPNGDVVVVEFFDYNCGYCKKAFSELQTLLKDDKNVKVVLYDMPILGPDSLEASRWAMASKKQNKYFEFHTALMTHTGARGEEGLKQAAAKAGLDVEKLMKDKADPSVDKELQEHIMKAQELGIQGTPGFLIGEKVFRGYVEYPIMQTAIKEARDAAKK